MNPAADPRVFALGVLANDDEVDIIRPLAYEPAWYALQKLDGAKVYILIECLADWQQETP